MNDLPGTLCLYIWEIEGNAVLITSITLGALALPSIVFTALLLHCICRRFRPFFHRHCFDIEERCFGSWFNPSEKQSPSGSRIFYNIPESMELNIEMFTAHQIIIRFSRLLLSSKRTYLNPKKRALAIVLIRNVSEHVGRLNAISVSSLIEFASNRQTLSEIQRLKQHQYEQNLYQFVIRAIRHEPHGLQCVV